MKITIDEGIKRELIKWVNIHLLQSTYAALMPKKPSLVICTPIVNVCWAFGYFKQFTCITSLNLSPILKLLIINT